MQPGWQAGRNRGIDRGRWKGELVEGIEKNGAGAQGMGSKALPSRRESYLKEKGKARAPKRYKMKGRTSILGDKGIKKLSKTR